MRAAVRSSDDATAAEAALIITVLIGRLCVLAVVVIMITIVAGLSLIIIAPALYVVFSKRD